MNKKNIGNILLEYGMITEQDLEEGINYQKTNNLRLGEALCKLGKIEKGNIDYILSRQLDIPFVLLKELDIDTSLIKKFDINFLISNTILPVYASENELSIVTDDPFNNDAVAKLEMISGKKIKIHSGNGEEIIQILLKNKPVEKYSNLKEQFSSVVKMISNTTFYRIDMLISGDKIEISVFGAGVKKSAASFMIESDLDIIDTVSSVGVELAWDKFTNNNCTFYIFYPLEKSNDFKIGIVQSLSPIIYPDKITFTDLQVINADKVFHSNEIIAGYSYLSFKTYSASAYSVNIADNVADS